MNASKPRTNEEWGKWAAQWDGMTHADKLGYCQNIGITYDTARHWRTACNVAAAPNMGKARAVKQEPEDSGFDTIDVLLKGRPSVNLDFVSFDIETSNLNADFSVILSAVVKPFGQKPAVFRADTYPAWKNNRSNDRDILKDIVGELSKHAIIVTHFGIGFDIPYIRAKCVANDIPPLPPMFGVDSWKIAKNNFKVSSRRLANLGEYFNIGEKSAVDGNTWVRAAYDGDTKAMDFIVEHNIQDCVLLEKLACLSFPYIKSIPRL